MSQPTQTVQARRLALRQQLRIAQETYDGYAAAVIEVKQHGKSPPPDLLDKEVAALRRVSELSQQLLELIGKS
jgi:hypothetical protein